MLPLILRLLPMTRWRVGHLVLNSIALECDTWGLHFLHIGKCWSQSLSRKSCLILAAISKELKSYPLDIFTTHESQAASRPQLSPSSIESLVSHEVSRNGPLVKCRRHRFWRSLRQTLVCWVREDYDNAAIFSDVTRQPARYSINHRFDKESDNML